MYSLGYLSDFVCILRRAETSCMYHFAAARSLVLHTMQSPPQDAPSAVSRAVLKGHMVRLC